MSLTSKSCNRPRRLLCLLGILSCVALHEGGAQFSGNEQSLKHMQELVSAMEQGGSSAFMADRVRRWADIDYPGAIAWVSTFQVGELRDGMMGQICLSLAMRSPAEAAKLAVDQMQHTVVRDRVLTVIAHQWGPRDISQGDGLLTKYGNPWNDRAVLALLGRKQRFGKSN
jgi:hypothetical protein